MQKADTADKGADEGFMRQALDQARVALQNGWIPVGAVFVRQRRIIATGIKTGAVHTLFDHAEHNGCYQALWSRSIGENLRDVTVYTTLEPCFMCLGLLTTTRVSRIVFACEDPYGGACRVFKYVQALPVRLRIERPHVEAGVLREESRALLYKFFKSQKRSGHKHWSDPNNALVKLAFDFAASKKLELKGKKKKKKK